jgi:hypothetical protein
MEAQDRPFLAPASSLAVRFAIAMDHPAASRILDLSQRMQRYCAARGFGLWLADRRHGCRAGNWFPILPPPHDGIRSRAIARCLPLTFVGPARVGATGAIVSFISQYPGVGIAACSITTLDDLAFVHFQLAFDNARKLDLVEVDKETVAVNPPAKLPFDKRLRTILQALGNDGDAVSDLEQSEDLNKFTGDYQCLAGPPHDVPPPDTRKRMALWFSWSTRGTELDLDLPVNGLLGALEDVGFPSRQRTSGKPGDTPNIEYLICRNKGNSVLRGKGKLSVPENTALRLSPNGGPGRFGRLCVAIEQAWRSRVAGSARGGARELTVAWRESWLGHWSPPA